MGTAALAAFYPRHRLMLSVPVLWAGCHILYSMSAGVNSTEVASLRAWYPLTLLVIAYALWRCKLDLQRLRQAERRREEVLIADIHSMVGAARFPNEQTKEVLDHEVEWQLPGPCNATMRRTSVKELYAARTSGDLSERLLASLILGAVTATATVPLILLDVGLELLRRHS